MSLLVVPVLLWPAFWFKKGLITVLRTRKASLLCSCARLVLHPLSQCFLEIHGDLLNLIMYYESVFLFQCTKVSWQFANGKVGGIGKAISSNSANCGRLNAARARAMCSWFRYRASLLVWLLELLHLLFKICCHLVQVRLSPISIT